MSNPNDYVEKIKSVLLSVSVSDALGVPAEFRSREELKHKPITDMQGFGTHSQPAGTFSDDTSLSLCLAEALTHEFDLNLIARYFVKWYDEGYWTAHGEVFDVGNATRHAICRLKDGVSPELAGGRESRDNGNGSLMRIAPLLFYIKDKLIEERFEITRQVSSITHAHIRSVIACFYYLEFARLILMGKGKFETYKELQSIIPSFLHSLNIDSTEISLFNRLFKEDIYELPESEIESSGYVLHTLEASIWCLLTTNNYRDAVLRAVNLGDDSDTTGATTGALCSLIYDIESIPIEWMNKLARRKDIEDLADRLGNKLI